MKLKEYYQQLQAHDWTHMMSDDHGVWKRGNAELKELKSIAKQSPQHQALFDAFDSYIWKGGPKPEEPTDG
jgi:hypothetical protein